MMDVKIDRKLIEQIEADARGDSLQFVCRINRHRPRLWRFVFGDRRYFVLYDHQTEALA